MGVGNFWESIFSLIIAFTVLGSTIRIFLTLLSKYVTLLVMVIFMPLALLWGSLPGQEDTGPKILKTYLSAALAFPATMFLLALTKYFALAKFGSNFMTIPPFYFGSFVTQLGGGVTGCLVLIPPPPAPQVCPAGQGVVQNLLAIGLLMLTAQIPSAIDDLLSVKGVSGGGEEIGGAIRKLPIIGSFLG